MGGILLSLGAAFLGWQQWRKKVTVPANGAKS